MDANKISGKVVFVAGGTSGINLGIAEAFARAGAKVAVASRNAERVVAATDVLKKLSPDCRGFVCDVRNREAVDAAVAGTVGALGPLDVVISGAAGNFLVEAADISPNGFRAVVDIDLIGTFNVFQSAFAHLRKPGASLIAISAPQGTRPQMKQVHVCAAKAGVNMLVKCLALEWGPLGIRVNAISPGLIDDTEGQRRLVIANNASEEALRTIPLMRIGMKSDIADTAIFLSSPFASFVTGVILDCDGGMALGQGGYVFADAPTRSSRS